MTQEVIFMPKGQQLSITGKIKLKKNGGLELIRQYIFEKPSDFVEDEEKIEFSGTQTVDCDLEAHQDLKRCMSNLLPHFLMLLDVVDEKKFKVEEVNKMMHCKAEDGTIPESLQEVMDKYQVRSISFSGDEEKETKCFIISGVQTIRGDKTVAVNTPRYKFEGETYPYKHQKVLNEIIEILEKEVDLYLSGKCAWTGQLSIDFNDTKKVISIEDKTGTNN